MDLMQSSDNGWITCREETNVGNTTDDRIRNVKGVEIERIDCISMGHRSIRKIVRVLDLSLNQLVIAGYLMEISRLSVHVSLNVYTYRR